MSKKLFLVLIIIVFFSIFNSVKAEVIINEFISDPDSGPEWIELLNTSYLEINLEGWQWSELASPGTDTEHESSLKGLSGVIPANGFFVFEMSSALNNSGDSIGLYNDTLLEDRVTFGKVNGFSKDSDVSIKGKSSAFVGGNWEINQEPTKGEKNQNSSSSSVEDDTSGESSSLSSQSATETKVKVIVSQKSKVQIISTKLAHTGVAFVVEGTGTNTEGEKLSHGRYYWNFGDGDFREVKVTSKEKFTHTYFYPGEYEIIFEYYPDFFADVPDASTKFSVKAVEPNVVISNVGNVNDFFIEITNETAHNADISNWKLLSIYRAFTFPKNTNLASNKKMTISPKITGFNIEDKNTLKLMTPEGDLASVYSSPFYKTSSKATRQDLVVKNISGVKVLENKEENVKENLSALALNSNVFKEKDSNSSLFMYILFVLFIILSTFLVYFIRHKKVVTKTGDDFEILDE